MRKLVTGMNINKGFTLIEILVVIVIIGVTVGFALLAFGDFGSSRRLHFAADQLVYTLKMAQQQALMEGSTLGLKIDNKSYQILKFKPPHQWVPISNKSIYKAIYFPDNTYVNATPASSSQQPGILISPSGDITPFTIEIGTNKGDVLNAITSKNDGTITLTKKPS